MRQVILQGNWNRNEVTVVCPGEPFHGSVIRCVGARRLEAWCSGAPADLISWNEDRETLMADLDSMFVKMGFVVWHEELN